MKYVFGPVPSRRLGRSLGIDLVPFKTCSYDCIYCQLGPTTEKTLERKSWGDCDEIIKEVLQEIRQKKVDIITFSGSGEPTLNKNLGVLIEEIKKNTEISVAVLTNGSLFYFEEVFRDLQKADLVIPSLDCGNSRSFEEINRPCPGLDFSSMVRGLKRFSSAFSGGFWLEIMLVKGFNDNEEELRQISSLLKEINPEKVQLNTVFRPPAEKFARPVSREKLIEVAGILWGKSEIIRDIEIDPGQTGEIEANQERIINLLKRRPCTLKQISSSLSLHQNEVIKFLELLEKRGQIQGKEYGEDVFYNVGKNKHQNSRRD